MDVARFGDRWEMLNELFHEAQTISPDAIDAWCAIACKGDRELEQYLRELLNVEKLADDTVRDSILQLAHEVTVADSLQGTRIGAYRIDRLLGKGGMGEVYLADRADGKFNKQVAIKVVQKRTRQQDFLRFFDTERRVMADLNHRYIPALLDAGQLEDGRPYFICDYIIGKPIDEYCEQHQLDPAARLALFERVGEALSYAHNNLVLHLDIKPENILIRSNGEPSLLDFGLSRLMTSMEEGVPAFSPQYASPEQLEVKPLSAASDVYSLGVLLHQVLTGLPPFRVDASKLSLKSIVGERQKMKARWRADGELKSIDQDLRAIIVKATDDDPLQRYSSAEALLLDLSRYHQHRPVGARKSTVMYRISKYLRRHTLEVGLAAGALALFVGANVRESSLLAKMEESLTVSHSEVQLLQQRSEQLQLAIGWLGQRALESDHEATMTISEVAQKFDSEPFVAAAVLLNAGRAATENGRGGTAIPMLDAAADYYAKAIETDQRDQANLSLAKLEAYLSIGQLDEVQRIVRKELDQNIVILDGRWLQLLDTALTQLLTVNAKTDAENLINDVIVALQAAGGNYHPAYAAGLSMRANVNYALTNVRAAEQGYREALSILQKSYSTYHTGDSGYTGRWIRQTMSDYSRLMRNDGRIDEASTLEHQVLQILNK